MELSLLPLGHHHHHPQLLINSPLHNRIITQKGVSRKSHLLSLACRCANDHSSSRTEAEPSIQGRRSFSGFLLAAAAGLNSCDIAEAVSTSRRALRGSKIPESDFKTLPNGLKYYDLKVGGGAQAVKGSRVAVHYVAKWKNITFMTSRQGLGVNGGSPYGFDVGQSERGFVLKGLDLGVEGMRVGGQRLLIVPPELAYGSKGVQEIPPNATIEVLLRLGARLRCLTSAYVAKPSLAAYSTAYRKAVRRETV